MTIFAELRQDHDHQRSLLKSLLETSGDSKTRRRLFDELKDNMANHAAAEERYFYGPLIDVDVTQKHARHSIAEHHELDELIEELEQTELSSPQWLQKFKHLAHRLDHHLEEEEREIFPLAGKHLKETQKETLADHYTKMMKEKEAS